MSENLTSRKKKGSIGIADIPIPSGPLPPHEHEKILAMLKEKPWENCGDILAEANAYANTAKEPSEDEDEIAYLVIRCMLVVLGLLLLGIVIYVLSRAFPYKGTK